MLVYVKVFFSECEFGGSLEFSEKKEGTAK